MRRRPAVEQLLVHAAAAGASDLVLEPQDDGALVATVDEILDDGLRVLEFSVGGADLREAIWRLGEMPTPPYVRRKLASPDQYQTVYARVDGSVAAPTAGFHFTPDLLAVLRDRGFGIEYITLHVGPGTFQPVKVADISRHRMHFEHCSIGPDVAARLNEARARGRPIVAVGTTSVRTLESAANDEGRVQPFEGQTRLFIAPGYRFRAVDALVTNFHLPRSTLLMLVSAFAGREFVLSAYAEAVRERYRFFSFGDSMLVL